MKAEMSALDEKLQHRFCTCGSKSGSDSEIIIQTASSGSDDSSIKFGDNGATDAGRIVYQHSDDSMAFGTARGNHAMRPSTRHRSRGHWRDKPKYRFSCSKNKENDEYALRVGNAKGGGSSTLGITKIGFDTGASSPTHSGAYIAVEQASTSGYQAELSFCTRRSNADVAPVEAMRLDSAGNVGIGTNAPSHPIHIKSGSISAGSVETNNQFKITCGDSASYGAFFSWGKKKGDDIYYALSIDGLTNNFGADILLAPSGGKVGIGGEPVTREAGEYLEQAKTQLKSWKAEVKKRTAEQPEASTQEITLEVTDGDFGVMPTVAALAEKLAERDIGGGNAKLQVAGDIWAKSNTDVTARLDIVNKDDRGIKFIGTSSWNYLQSCSDVNGNSGWHPFIITGANGLDNRFCIDQDGLIGIGGTPNAPNIGTGIVGGTATLQVAGDVYFSGKIFGDGSGLTNLPGGSGGGGTYTAGNGIDINNTDSSIAMSGSYSGDFTVSGTVNASATKATPDAIYWKNSAEGSGLRMSSSEIYPVNAENSGLNGGAISIGAASAKFKDGHFTEFLDAGWFGTAGNGGVRIGSRNNRQHFFATDDNGDTANGTADLGFDDGSVVKRWRNGYFTGTVDAGGFTVNGQPISAGGDYVPLTGNSTVNGTITATDFIATSDERLKDNITPMPVGLIDDIKPVSWDWKDGGKSAGVVAQQLQAIGLDDYVHENDDGQLGVNYQALTAILLAEVIDLKRRLAE